MKHVLLGFVMLVNVASYQNCDKSKLELWVHVSPTANNNNPVAVDLVLVRDKKLQQELMKMSASEWFERRHQIQLDYPKETDLDAGSWEWVPGQTVQLEQIPVRREIVGGVIFARYFTQGPHRVILDPRKHILIKLGEHDITVEVLKK